MAKLSLFTPTGGRPKHFALCENWISRQTFKNFDWFVADDTPNPVTLTCGQVACNARYEGCSLGWNLLHCFMQCSKFPIAIIEDDVWYAPTYLETVNRILNNEPLVALHGFCPQFVYNIEFQKYIIISGRPALSEIFLGEGARRAFTRIIRTCHTNIDAALFADQSLKKNKHAVQTPLAVSLKGFGQKRTLGSFHNDDNIMKQDSDYSQLRLWVGEQDFETIKTAK